MRTNLFGTSTVFYGYTNIQVKVFDCCQSQSNDMAKGSDKRPGFEVLNEFLREHDGNIIDIQMDYGLYGVSRCHVIYRDVKED